MGPSIGPIVLLFSSLTSVQPYMVDPDQPNDPAPIQHVELPNNINQLRISADRMVWVFVAHEEHRDVVVRTSLDRSLNGQWGKFVACTMTPWGSCDITVGPYEADITDVYLAYWGPDAFTDPDPSAYAPANVNLVATRIEEPNLRPTVNVDVEINLFDLILRRFFGGR